MKLTEPDGSVSRKCGSDETCSIEKARMDRKGITGGSCSSCGIDFCNYSEQIVMENSAARSLVSYFYGLIIVCLMIFGNLK